MSELIALDPSVEAALYAHGAVSRKARDRGDLHAAITHLLAGWEVIPEPRLQHENAPMLAVSFTKLYRDVGQFDHARVWLARAREAYGPDASPLTEFLAATVHYAAGEFDQADALFDALYRAWKKRPFEGEDPVYLNFYLERRA